MANNNVIILNSNNFDQEVMHSDIPVFIDFWASWCGPCRMVAPIVDQLADDYEGRLKVCKVNVDEEMNLASKYKVMTIPTLMIMKNGTMVERVIGYKSKEELKNIIDNALK